MQSLKELKKDILIYEPQIKDKLFFDCKVENKFNIFLDSVDIIIANRKTDELEDISVPVFSRDIYGEN